MADLTDTISLTDTEYNQLVNVLIAFKTKLDTLKPHLERIMRSDEGKQKLVRWMQNNPTQARLLVKARETAIYFEQLSKDIGWKGNSE